MTTINSEILPNDCEHILSLTSTRLKRVACGGHFNWAEEGTISQQGRRPDTDRPFFVELSPHVRSVSKDVK
jgi:hypothetical protein